MTSAVRKNVAALSARTGRRGSSEIACPTSTAASAFNAKAAVIPMNTGSGWKRAVREPTV
jgi:hypothetical protein